MAALSILLGAAILLLALAATHRAAPAFTPKATSLLCLAALPAALLAPPIATLGGPIAFGIDGLSAALLAALSLWGAATRRHPALLGALALALLAADGLVLTLAMAIALAAAAAFARPTRLPALLALAALIAALLLLGGLDLRFAAMRDGIDGPRGAALLAATLAAAALLTRALPPFPGHLAALYLAARLLLDLAGPATPAWWGAPVLALGTLAALDAARRLATAASLPEAAAQSGAAAIGAGMAALGAALLARGADIPPLAALSVTAALVQPHCAAAWAGLLALSADAVATAVGGPELSRTGGLLRRMPATGLAMLVALLSMAGIPVTAGFAAIWLTLQSILGAGRAGGTAILLLATGSAAALAFAAALLALAALRLAGAALLGTPRTAKAAAAAEPPWPHRVAIAALAAAVLLLGLCPGLGTLLVQPAVRLLANGAAEGAGLLTLAPGTDLPGYAAPLLALPLLLALLATLLAPLARSHRIPPLRTPPLARRLHRRRHRPHQHLDLPLPLGEGRGEGVATPAEPSRRQHPTPQPEPARPPQVPPHPRRPRPRPRRHPRLGRPLMTAIHR